MGRVTQSKCHGVDSWSFLHALFIRNNLQTIIITPILNIITCDCFNCTNLQGRNKGIAMSIYTGARGRFAQVGQREGGMGAAEKDRDASFSSSTRGASNFLVPGAWRLHLLT